MMQASKTPDAHAPGLQCGKRRVEGRSYAGQGKFLTFKHLDLLLLKQVIPFRISNALRQLMAQLQGPGLQLWEPLAESFITIHPLFSID
jgi:hypothetical protein